jgi:hypothetical protein
VDAKTKKLIVAVVLLVAAAAVITFNAVRVFSPPPIEEIEPGLVAKPQESIGGVRVLDGSAP